MVTIAMANEMRIKAEATPKNPRNFFHSSNLLNQLFIVLEAPTTTIITHRYIK